jgi:uncharacterized protein
VGILNAAGADINRKNADGLGAERTALFCAVERQCCTFVLDVLLRAGADPCAITSPAGLTAFHLAAQNGFTEACEMLLARADALLEKRDASGRTALVHATTLGRLNIVNLLVQHGANVNTIDKWNQSPLFYAAFNRHVEITECLLTAGADVNATDNKGHGALMAAVHNNNTALLQLLLAHGADVTVTDYNGHNALTKAADKGYVPMMEY